MFKVDMVSLLLALNIFHHFSRASIVNFEQVNVCWDSAGLFKQNIICAMALRQEITSLILSVTFYLMAPIDYTNEQNIIHKVI